LHEKLNIVLKFVGFKKIQNFYRTPNITDVVIPIKPLIPVNLFIFRTNTFWCHCDKIKQSEDVAASKQSCQKN